jgi:hypothetical protein
MLPAASSMVMKTSNPFRGHIVLVGFEKGRTATD